MTVRKTKRKTARKRTPPINSMSRAKSALTDVGTAGGVGLVLYLADDFVAAGPFGLGMLVLLALGTACFAWLGRRDG